MLQYCARLLVQVAGICSSLVVGLLIYVSFYIWTKRKNYIRLRKQLSEYPMPGLSNYLIGHLDQFTDQKTEWEWSKKFGKIYAFFNVDRIQARTTDQELINEIFLKRSREFHSRVWFEYRLLFIFKSILFNKGKAWKHSRRLILPALAAYRVKTNENLGAVKDLSDGIFRLARMFKKLCHGVGGAQDSFGDQQFYKQKGFVCLPSESSPTGRALEIKAYDMMQLITLDVIFRLGFNQETVRVENGIEDPQLQMIKTWMAIADTPLIKYSLTIPPLRILVYIYVRFMTKHYRVYQKFMDNLIEGQPVKQPGASNGDLGGGGASNSSCKSSHQTRDEAGEIKDDSGGPKRIYHVLREEYHSGRMDKYETCSQMFAVLFAGFETTATTASYILWCLAKHREHQALVSVDIRRQGIGSKYLDMFIKEVMRMYPALPNFVMRTPHQDTQVAGYKIKRGMSVYLGVNTVHYDASIWAEPHRFDPERFAEGKTYPPGAYVPFGLGHRMCAGYQLAMREMKTIVCELLSSFVIELVQPDELSLESSNIFLTKATREIRVRLIPRAAEC